MVSEDGKTFYGEFTDYDKNQVDEWIQKNVINNMLYTPMLHGCMGGKTNAVCVGDKKKIRQALEEWLEQFNEVQLVSDVCHYDMVLFADIFGEAFSLPKNVSPCCYDINQDISKVLHCSMMDAFDVSREGLLETWAPEVKIEGNKHNALYDAMVIAALYKVMDKILENNKRKC